MVKKIEKKVILCFDFRRPFKNIATIDPIVWPYIQCIENAEEFKKKSPLEPKIMEWFPPEWVLCTGFFSHIPTAWIQKKTSNDFCVNAYCISRNDFLFLEGKFKDDFYPNDFLYRPSLELLIENNWISLGFDVGSASLSTSAIYTTEEMQYAKRHKHMWNEYGLIKNSEYCLELMSSNEFKPHDPTTFMPVEIWTNNFAPASK